MAGGRPTKYNKELCDLICQRVATHTCGLKALIDKYKDMPSEPTIYDWRYIYPEFSKQYAQAKMHQAELMAEMLCELSKVDNYEYKDEEGVTRVDSGIVGARRLQVDTIKWQASKLAPKIYGDKTQNDSVVTVRYEDALKELK